VTTAEQKRHPHPVFQDVGGAGKQRVTFPAAALVNPPFGFTEAARDEVEVKVEGAAPDEPSEEVQAPGEPQAREPTERGPASPSVR